MCGISAIFTKNKSDDLVLTVKKMISRVQYRGPDGWGTYHSPNVAIGHTRLSIIDLVGGNQPMMTERYVITYNGEIYNYIELREILKKKGFFFRTTSDTEVVLRAFEEYGLDAFAKFNGQFALLIYDKLEKKIIIARDRYGIRPLYIIGNENEWYFASEIKCFDVIKDFKRDFDLNSLFEHGLLWNTLDDRTVYKSVRSLPAGTCEVYSLGNQPKQIRFYEIGESEDKIMVNSFSEALDHFDSLLNDSVALRLRSDVPVANYLSGGIDSSVTTYLTSVHNSRRFNTFSVTFDDRDLDESVYQTEMVKRIKSTHCSRFIDTDLIHDYFVDTLYHAERPLFRTAPVPMFLLSESVKDMGLKVVLTGEAADEVLWGYDSYKEIKLLEFWARNPTSSIRPQLIKKLYPHLQHYSDHRQYGMMKMFYEGFLPHFTNDLTGLNIRISNNKALTFYFNKDWGIRFDFDDIYQKIHSISPNNYKNWTLYQKNQFLEMRTLLQGYLLSSQGDRMSMSHGVEGRYPFLDHRLVEWLFYLPDKYKLNGFTQKYLLKKAFIDTIPQSIINRPKLPYQAPDLKAFISKDGKQSYLIKKYLSERALKDSGIFESRQIARLLKKYDRGYPQKIGYRDNMILIFTLSTQILWDQNNQRKKIKPLDPEKQTVKLVDER